MFHPHYIALIWILHTMQQMKHIQSDCVYSTNAHPHEMKLADYYYSMFAAFFGSKSWKICEHGHNTIIYFGTK